MPLIDDVSTAIADAMRQQDAVRLSALRMLKAALMNARSRRAARSTTPRRGRWSTALVKQRKDSIEQFTKGGRQDLADKEAAEIGVLEAYLPPAADPAAVERAVAEAIAETGATSPKDMGRVMKAAMAKLAGQSVDGKTVNELVRSKLPAPAALARCSAPTSRLAATPRLARSAGSPARRRSPAASSASSAIRCSPRCSAPATRWTRSSSRSGFPTSCAICSPKAR